MNVIAGLLLIFLLLIIAGIVFYNSDEAKYEREKARRNRHFMKLPPMTNSIDEPVFTEIAGTSLNTIRVLKK